MGGSGLAIRPMEARLATDPRLVYFDHTGQVGNVLGQKATDQVEHAPRRLVPDAKLAL
jgi:hypothetical protein